MSSCSITYLESLSDGLVDERSTLLAAREKQHLGRGGILRHERLMVLASDLDRAVRDEAAGGLLEHLDLEALAEVKVLRRDGEHRVDANSREVGHSLLLANVSVILTVAGADSENTLVLGGELLE